MTNHGDARTITLVVTFTIKPEREAEFLAYSREFASKVHAGEPGAVLYVLTKDPSRPHTYIWVERYRDQAAFDAHMQTSYMAEAKTKLPDWLADKPTGMRLDQVIPD